MNAAPTLKRELGFWALVAYGVGDILGAGVYALVGEVAGIAGIHAWAAFAVALVVAALTALSFAELSSRYPRSAGVAAYCQEAFRDDRLAFLIGWLMLCAGVVSMATIARAFAGYLSPLLPDWPTWASMVGFLLALTALNLAGIRQASAANILCTLIEASGLVVVIVVGLRFWAAQEDVAPQLLGPQLTGSGLLQAGALAFFAFIGFEDMVNVAEEVKAPQGNLPRAILTALGISAALYMVVAAVAVHVIPPSQLAASPAPLLEVVRRAAPHFPIALFTAITVFAVANTSLLNHVSSSRLVYGMARDHLLPPILGRIHPRRRTPQPAILLVGAVALAGALTGRIASLAGATSALILVVFAAVNGSLILVKRRPHPQAAFRVPFAIPVSGLMVSLGLVVFLPRQSLAIAALVLALGLALYAVQQRLRSAP